MRDCAGLIGAQIAGDAKVSSVASIGSKTMGSEYERLVADVADRLHREWSQSDVFVAKAIIALIAERTKEATSEMFVEGLSHDDPVGAWRAMHSRSGLYPPRAAKDVEGERG